MFHACGPGIMKLHRTAVGADLSLSLAIRSIGSVVWQIARCGASGFSLDVQFSGGRTSPSTWIPHIPLKLLDTNRLCIAKDCSRGHATSPRSWQPMCWGNFERLKLVVAHQTRLFVCNDLGSMLTLAGQMPSYKLQGTVCLPQFWSGTSDTANRALGLADTDAILSAIGRAPIVERLGS
jgi:hypothetical protein